MAQKPQKDHFTQFFVDMEHKWLAHWHEKGVVKKYLHKNDTSDKRFSFQDGPITANNPMGVHHAWGRTYKDVWQKFYNLLGYRQRFINGFDCQGLWVEVEVEKELKLRSKKDIENLVEGDTKASIAKFVQLCKDRVNKFAHIQTEQSKRLGYFMDWEHSYYTMSDENNYMIWHFLKKCHENGWIYKGHESVPWCPRCQTAISQHEMLTEDYKEVVHDSIYFELPIIGREHEYLLVWTTTPWTIPANIAVAVDKNIDYSLVQGTSGDVFWVAKELVESVFSTDYQKIIKTVKGSELVGLKYGAPFDDLDAVKKVAQENPDTFHTVIATDPLIMPITTSEGTGIVHTAVSAGTEDFRLGKKLGLPMIPVIADNADYLPHMGPLAYQNAKKHPEIVFDYMKERDDKGENWIFEIRKYQHRYPGCWRCKTELVWKVADEWYIAMDLPAKAGIKNEELRMKNDKRTLRERMIEVTKKITWMPAFGLARELDWLENMHDWLISKKNRYWGLALPIYECKDCKTFEVIGSKAELKERSIAGWEQFEGKSPHKPYIDEVIIACPACGKEARRIGDVGNPWLDAGIVPYSTIMENNQGQPLYLKKKEEWKKWFPADFITESFPGQFKNWFYAMIAMSTVLEDINPYKRVLGFATMVDENGRAFHKSAGNAIEFVEGANMFGADLIRWSVMRSNPAENIYFGEKMIRENRRQFYLLLWNTYKYYKQYAEIDGFTYSSKTPSTQNLPSILDAWILMRLKQTQITAKESLERYDPRTAAESIESFVSDTSTWFLRRSRNRGDKESFYRTISWVLADLCIILSPLMPFISEEIYTALTGAESVHLSHWPEQDEITVEENLIQDMATVRAIVEVGHRVRKDHQIKVRQPLAKVEVHLPSTRQLLIAQNEEAYRELIAAELNVKSVEFSSEKATELSTTYDTTLTPKLKKEGELRELMRSIQNKRKKLGVKVNDKVNITINKSFAQFEDQIKKQVNAQNITYGTELVVELAQS